MKRKTYNDYAYPEAASRGYMTFRELAEKLKKELLDELSQTQHGSTPPYNPEPGQRPSILPKPIPAPVFKEQPMPKFNSFRELTDHLKKLALEEIVHTLKQDHTQPTNISAPQAPKYDSIRELAQAMRKAALDSLRIPETTTTPPFNPHADIQTSDRINPESSPVRQGKQPHTFNTPRDSFEFVEDPERDETRQFASNDSETGKPYSTAKGSASFAKATDVYSKAMDKVGDVALDSTLGMLSDRMKDALKSRGLSYAYNPFDEYNLKLIADMREAIRLFDSKPSEYKKYLTKKNEFAYIPWEKFRFARREKGVRTDSPVVDELVGLKGLSRATTPEIAYWLLLSRHWVTARQKLLKIGPREMNSVFDAVSEILQFLP